jgi:hypothetical protein
LGYLFVKNYNPSLWARYDQVAPLNGTHSFGKKGLTVEDRAGMIDIAHGQTG